MTTTEAIEIIGAYLQANTQDRQENTLKIIFFADEWGAQGLQELAKFISSSKGVPKKRLLELVQMDLKRKKTADNMLIAHATNTV